MRDLVEIANFPTPITVPEGSDFMDTLAEDLAAVFQSLANRTQYLKGFVELALYATDPVVIPGRLTTQKTASANPFLQMGYGPHDDPDHPSAKWSLYGQMKLVPPYSARIYAGDGTEGWFCITVNASYDPAGPAWHYDSNAQHAYAFMLSSTGTWFLHTQQGSDGWTTWDNLAARVFANTVAADNLTVTNELDYATTTTRQYRANIAAAGYPAFRDSTNGHLFFIADAVDTYQEIALPLYLPRDGVVSEVRIRHNQATNAQDRFTLRRRNGDLGAIVYEEIAHADATATIGTRTTTITITPRTVDAAEDWSVVWKLNAPGDPAAVGGNYVIGVEYDLTAPGPRG